MAKIPVKVPDIGGAEGAEVIELLVAVGDEVELEQSLIVLESDKASMEIPSAVAGTVVELLVNEGEVRPKPHHKWTFPKLGKQIVAPHEEYKVEKCGIEP